MTNVQFPPEARDRKPKKTLTKFNKLVESKDIERDDLDEYREKVKKLYGGPAGAVLALASVASLHEPLVGRMLRKKRFDVTDCKSVLDIGSGAGQILGHLLKRTHPEARLIATDLSHQMLRRARVRVKSDRPYYLACDLHHLPFADNCVDCITCGWVLEHLPDPKPGLTELQRVLKPGGSMLLMTSEATVWGAFVSRAWKCRTYDRAELQEACESVGLPWTEELPLTPVHRFFKMGGIIVEARKPEA